MYVAKLYQAASPDVLVLGQTMRAFLENVQADVIHPILKANKIEEIDAGKWYPHQLWMDILKDIEETLGEGAQTAFVAFGRKVVETAAMPPEMNSIPAALNSLHAIHHLNLQNIPEEEGYHIEVCGEKHYQVFENTPNPPEVIYGFLWGICRRFRKNNEEFSISIIPNPKPDIQPGTVYDITWD